MAYLAAKQLVVGTGEPDPERPGKTLVKVYEPGEEVDVSTIDNVEALVDNGYLANDEVEETPPEETPEEAPAEETPAEEPTEGGEGE